MENKGPLDLISISNSDYERMFFDKIRAVIKDVIEEINTESIKKQIAMVEEPIEKEQVIRKNTDKEIIINFYNHFSKRIESQSALARLLKIPQPYISKILVEARREGRMDNLDNAQLQRDKVSDMPNKCEAIRTLLYLYPYTNKSKLADAIGVTRQTINEFIK